MGKSSKSHAKKSDKETQSPLLRIFKEMMQKECHDPEKANLLKEKRRNKKRKQYSSSASKSEGKSFDSSGNEGIKNKADITMKEQNRAFSQCRTQSIPFQSGKRDSWWVWQSEADKRNQNAETCSCVSCALKKIISNEYTCIGCLLFILTITVVAAFLLVFRSIPTTRVTQDQDSEKATNPEQISKERLDSESFKQKIDMLNEKRGRNAWKDGESGVWDDSSVQQSESFNGMDFGDVRFRDSNELSDYTGLENGHTDMLASILESSKINDNSKPLRDFYKKLIQTDKLIKNLKDEITQFTTFPATVEFNSITERYKRSLYHKFHSNTAKADSKHNVIIIETTTHNPIKTDEIQTEIQGKEYTNKRLKRYENGSLIPTGILIEKKKMLIQYFPKDKKKFPKCSHATKETNSHENQLKHPFYNNTQRLDELLNQFMDKRISFPDFINEPIKFDQILKGSKKCKYQDITTKSTSTVTQNPLQYIYTTTDEIYNRYIRPQGLKFKSGFLKILKSESSTDSKRHSTSRYADDFDDELKDKDSLRTSSPGYDLYLSISTLINPIASKDRRVTNRASNKFLEIIPNVGRKLLQADGEEEEDGIGFEDLKEVLSDDMKTHDETERDVDRKKRGDSGKEFPLHAKYIPPSIHNPNWKGAMPLYPDELSISLKTNEKNKVDEPSIKNSNKYETDRSEINEISDVQYVEDYTHNKFNKFVKMAQAYSDYGVLDAKKDFILTEKRPTVDDKALGHTVKMFAENTEFLRSRSFGRPKKGLTSEGIVFEIRPGGKPKDDNASEFLQHFSKHIKFTKCGDHGFHSTTLFPKNSELDELEKLSVFSARRYLSHKAKEKEKSDVGFRSTFTNNKRSLKSVELEDTSDADNDNVDVKVTEKEVFGNSQNIIPKRFESKIEPLNDLITEDGKNQIISKNRLKRSLKSIDFDIRNGVKDSETAVEDLKKLLTNTNSFIVELNLKSNNESFKDTNLFTINGSDKEFMDAKSLNLTKSTINGGADFFMMLSDWFSTLAGMGPDKNGGKDPGSNVKLNKANEHKDNVPKEVMYPMYDADMIDNIAHRSRVLMSVEDDPANASGHTENIEEDANIIEKGSTTSPGILIDAYNDRTSTKPINITKLDTNATMLTKSNLKLTEKNKTDDTSLKGNKTIVKRNAEDSNLIFWNDIYDDEYGVQSDPLDKSMKDKDSATNNNIMKKSRLWLQDKVKRLSNSFHKREKYDDDTTRTRSVRSINDFGFRINSKDGDTDDFHSTNTRNYDFLELNAARSTMRPLMYSEKKNFADLTAYMKEVCRQAAQEVDKTRRIVVRENGKESAAAAGLMQQLVKLMTEVVDYQVQLKTCLKLPAELRGFLEWLTHPPDPDTVPKPTDNPKAKPKVKSMQQLVDLPSLPSSEKEEVHADVRSDCLGTLHAVQDLMQQYNDMSDADKSKMTGVKEYLEVQMSFLQKQLTTTSDNYSTYYSPSPLRYRRYAYDGNERNIRRRPHKRRDDQRRNRLNKFMRHFGKKHTRTTAKSYDEMQMSTETIVKKDDNVDSNIASEDEAKLYQETKIDQIDAIKTMRNSQGETNESKNKKNLQDVYYRTLADVSKFTTVKSMHMKSFASSDYTESNRV